MADAKMREITMDEVAKHDKDGDCWIVVDNKVFDVSKFARMHPGGKKVLTAMGGKVCPIKRTKPPAQGLSSPRSPSPPCAVKRERKRRAA